jgi:hypothetical protein
MWENWSFLKSIYQTAWVSEYVFKHNNKWYKLSLRIDEETGTGEREQDSAHGIFQ